MLKGIFNLTQLSCQVFVWFFQVFLFGKKEVMGRGLDSLFSFLACHANASQTVVLSNTTRGLLGIPLETTVNEYQNNCSQG